MPANAKRKLSVEEDYSDDDAPEEILKSSEVRRKSEDWPSDENGSTDNTDASASEDDWSDEDATEDEEDQDEQADIPLGQLLAQKQDGASFGPAAKHARAKLAKRSSAATAAGDGDATAGDSNGRKKTSFKRDHKHKPSEQSSKRPVSIFRDTLQAGKREIRDPRFQSLTAGQFKEEAFKKRYSFLYDEKLPQEKKELSETLKKTKSATVREQTKARLAQITQQMKEEAARRKRTNADAEERSKRNAAVAAGKTPFYLKKSDKRKQELISKYEELKKAGKLEKFMEKRRKKNAAKDHRYLPGSRRGGDGE